MTKGKEWKLLHLSSSQPVALPTYQPFMPSGFSTAWQRAIVPGTILSISKKCISLSVNVRSLFLDKES